MAASVKAARVIQVTIQRPVNPVEGNKVLSSLLVREDVHRTLIAHLGLSSNKASLHSSLTLIQSFSSNAIRESKDSYSDSLLLYCWDTDFKIP